MPAKAPTSRKARSCSSIIDPARPVAIERGENSGTTVTYWNSVTGIQTAGIWHGAAARYEFPASEIAKKGPAAAPCCCSRPARTAFRADPRRSADRRPDELILLIPVASPKDRPAAIVKSRTAKNRCQFGADTGLMVLGSSHLVPCKNQVGSIRPRPRGRGAWGLRSRCRTEPSQATRGCSSDNGARGG